MMMKISLISMKLMMMMMMMMMREHFHQDHHRYTSTTISTSSSALSPLYIDGMLLALSPSSSPHCFEHCSDDLRVVVSGSVRGVSVP